MNDDDFYLKTASTIPLTFPIYKDDQKQIKKIIKEEKKAQPPKLIFPPENTGIK